MTLSRSNPRAKGRWLFLGLVTTALMLAVAAVTLAVHDEDFQLDRDIITTPDGTVGGNTQEIDWADLFDANGAELGLPAGFTASGFKPDFVTNANGTFNTSDNTTFATGSKDTLNITPGWQCNVDNNVLSKNDVMNAYAASYESASGDELLYFALERNANTGTANVAFWFLQDDTVQCVSPGGSTAFTGNHQDGDLLAVSEFSQGGVVSTIQVYRWDGGANGSLNPNPVASGVDCAGTAGGDDVCGTVNTGTISTPWLTSNKQDGVGHSLRVSEFFEGGINLTDNDLGGRCFNVFMADTRSSTSLTATLFDFSRGQLGQCTSTTVTTPKAADGTTTFVNGTDIPLTGTLEVRDSALITVTGADTFTADVTFYLCGPGTLGAAPDVCDADAGVQIGDPVAVTANGTYLSPDDEALLTSAGRYCWRAEFSGDDTVGVPPSEDASIGECFIVDPVQPTMVTTATRPTPVPFGQPITDTIALSGTANQEGTNGDAPEATINATRGAGAGGTLSVTAFGPNSCTTVAHGPITINVSGNGSYGGVGSTLQFTPAAPGQYVFVASYSGDLPNTLGIAATACAAQPDAEKVTVEQIPTDIKTRQSWFPNDTATVSAASGNLVAGGSVLFELYTNATCTGATVYSESVAVPGGAASAEVGTNNLTYRISTLYTAGTNATIGKHSWRVTYTPAATDTAHRGSRSICDAENFTITYTNDAGPGIDFP